MNASNRKRVLVIEDDPLNRQYLKEQLASIELDAHAVATGPEALNQKLESYDLITLDMELRRGRINGVALGTELAQAGVPILVVSVWRFLALYETCRRFAKGYVLKDEIEEFPNAVKRVLAGDEYWADASLFGNPLDRYDCTDKELQVAQLMRIGMSNHEIAEFLGNSTQTIHNQVKSLHDRLGTKGERTRLLMELARLIPQV